MTSRRISAGGAAPRRPPGGTLGARRGGATAPPPPRASGRHLALRRPLEPRPDQVLDVAVEHLVGVVAHGAGAVVLDVLLVEHVAADLGAPLDGLLLAARLHLLLEAPLLLALEEARAQHRHGLLAVLDLRLAVLAGHDDLLGRARLVDH